MVSLEQMWADVLLLRSSCKAKLHGTTYFLLFNLKCRIRSVFLCISHTGQLRCADWDGERLEGGKGCELRRVGADWCALELWGSVAVAQCEGSAVW